jgi:hypothetical protein
MLVGRAAGKWGAGLKEKKKREREREKVFAIFQKINQMNSNMNLNPNIQKQCTSMNATEKPTIH